MKRIAKCCLAVALGFAVAGCSKGSSQGSGGGEHKKVQLWEDGPYWAETNIGAEKPWESGYYFWWGDATGYKYVDDAWVASDGSSSGFLFDEHMPTWRKNEHSLWKEGWITAEGVLAPNHDAAHVQWGGKWRMPTDRELQALFNNCDWTWTKTNGVNGYVVRGWGKYASSSIFFPAAGCGIGTSLIDAGLDGGYWASVPDSADNYAWGFLFNSSSRVTFNKVDRYGGLPVRPVQGFTK